MQKQNVITLVAGFALWGALLNGMNNAPAAEQAVAQDDAAVVQGPAEQQSVPALLEVLVQPNGHIDIVKVDFLNSDALREALMAELTKNNSWETVSLLLQQGVLLTARGSIMLLVLVTPYVAAAGKSAFEHLIPLVEQALAAARNQVRRGWNAAEVGVGHVANRVRQRRAGVAA